MLQGGSAFVRARLLCGTIRRSFLLVHRFASCAAEYSRVHTSDVETSGYICQCCGKSKGTQTGGFTSWKTDEKTQCVVRLTFSSCLLLVFQAVAVHCLWGIGRTGTMLACYLVKEQNLTADQAIDEIRRLRPYSVETYEQEELVHQYFEHLRSS